MSKSIPKPICKPMRYYHWAMALWIVVDEYGNQMPDRTQDAAPRTVNESLPRRTYTA